MSSIASYSVVAETVFGKTDDHLCEMSDGILLHREVVKPWQQLVQAAEKAGFALRIASGYRSFDRQLAIWNRKLTGQRPLLDDSGCPLDLANLSPIERIEQTMRWSALPAASRHHWGTDMDIYDESAIDNGYELQLIPEEYCGDGPFAPLCCWLQDYLAVSDLGFFFPYRQDEGGVIPEPWHLSYWPVAKVFQQRWNLEDFRQQLSLVDIEEKGVLLHHLEHLYQRFIDASINSRFE